MWRRRARRRHTSKKVVPIITWVPWNPVATKKVVPKTLSAIVKGASIYSFPWRKVKYTPRETVRKIAFMASVLERERIAWWAQVTDTPDARRTAVLRRGTAKGLMGVMPVGGQVQPREQQGERLLWKKGQKKEKKNATSDKIKGSRPVRRPRVT